ncbi:hypothetical protein ACFU8X_14035 [Brevibacillus porteri]|uniref:hypothetical protein n=1 Tax=Brevibacillus porteri TaxID=2126350 RepID=UPI00370A4E04
MAIHTFQPQLYYNNIGSHEPALVINDGDVTLLHWKRNYCLVVLKVLFDFRTQ